MYVKIYTDLSEHVLFHFFPAKPKQWKVSKNPKSLYALYFVFFPPSLTYFKY